MSTPGAIAIKTQAVLSAYEKLTEAERAQVDWLANWLDEGMKGKSEHILFSHRMAVELIGKVGMLWAVHEPPQQAGD